MISDKFRKFLNSSSESRMSLREAKRICERAGYTVSEDSKIRSRDFLSESEEKLFIVQLTDLEYKSTKYLTSLEGSVLFATSLSIENAIKVTKKEFEDSSIAEKIKKETYITKTWDKKKWKTKLIPYVPNINELIPINVVQDNKHFKYSDVKRYFKNAGIKIIFEEKGSYMASYGDREIYNTIYIDKQDLEKAEDLIAKQLKYQIDIGFAWPDSNISARDKLKYDKN